MDKKLLSAFLLVLTDLLCFLMVYTIAFIIRKEVAAFLFPSLPSVKFSAEFLLFSLIWFIEFLFNGLYTKRRELTSEAKSIFIAHLRSSIILLALSYMLKIFYISRGIVLLILLLGFPLFLNMRILTKFILYRLGIWGKSIVFIGMEPPPAIKKMGENFFMGYRSPFFFPLRNPSSEIFQIHEKLQNLKNFDIVIDSKGINPGEIQKMVETLGKIGDSMMLIPDISGIATTGGEISIIEDVPLLNVNINLAKPWNLYIKNFFDLAATILLLILLLPFLLIISGLLLAFDGRPIIFSQERLGRRGKTFKMYKFRTMYRDAEKKLHEYLSANVEASKEWEKFMKLKGPDPRVTPLGRLIRKFSIDELPQLFNVLKGEMSLIGPRPYLPREIEKMGAHKNVILRVKPGITGLWQVSGRNLLTFEERLKLDEFYVRNWSLWLDAVILFKSFVVVLKGEGAY